jgi:osmotically-inducible protein OsmY
MTADRDLQKSVLEELSWEPSITAAHIGVSAKDGVIALTGHVENYMEKFAAEQAAGRVKGVKAVAEEIEVRLPIDTNRSDEEIAAAALNRLAWSVSVPRDAVKVRVEKGWVTLTGEVAWHYQKEAAEHDVRSLFGVVGVSNQITIKAQVDAVHVQDEVMQALHRSWLFDPAISVSATGGRVKLSGTVRTPHDRRIAGATAWAAPGVTVVENDILVA